MPFHFCEKSSKRCVPATCEACAEPARFRRGVPPAGALRRPFSVAAGEVSGLPAVVLSSDEIEVGVLTGGGHIASIRAKNLPSGVEDVNPLWQPPWQTSDPSLRRLLGPAIGDGAPLPTPELKKVTVLSVHWHWHRHCA